MFFDEIVFQHQCLIFVTGNDEINRRDFSDKKACLDIANRLRKGRNTVAQVFCLSDINDFS
jgi:hypothetical protein